MQPLLPEPASDEHSLTLAVLGSLPTFFALLRKKLPSGSALGETPQEQILRLAALHTTGQ